MEIRSLYDCNTQLNMDDKQIQTLEQVKQFVASSQTIEFKGVNTQEKYRWIEEVLRKFKYQWLKRNGKGIIRRYIEKVTGYLGSKVAIMARELEVEVIEYYGHPQKYTM